MHAAQNISRHHKPFVVSNSYMQERERGREREGRRRKKRGEGGRRPERGDRNKDGMQNAAPSRNWISGVLQARQREERKGSPGRPPEEKEEEKEREGEGGRERQKNPEMPFHHVKTKRCKGERYELFGRVCSNSSCIFGLDTYAWAHVNKNTWGDCAHPSQKFMCPPQSAEVVCHKLLL